MSEFSENGKSRRTFFRNSSAALLAGYAFTNRTGLAQNVQRPDSDSYQSHTINTNAFSPYGSVQERLDFPKDWQVDVMDMVGKDRPPLTSQQILQKLRSPIGSKPLRDIAAGKKNAVITFDDMTRPTYFGPVAEQVINELNAAGIDDDHILFLCAVGSHSEMHSYGAMAKLGPVVYNRCTWETHNRYDNFIQVGKTGFNNMIELNGYFAKADVKILMGSIRTHGGYVFGGGPKSIIPGVVSVDTIFYNHCVVGGVDVRRRRSYESDTRAQVEDANIPLFEKIGGRTPYNRRLDAVEAARLAGVDFSISIIHKGTQECIDLYCGDVDEAHVEGCMVANELQVYNRPAPRAGEYDIMVRNTYPCPQQGVRFASPREGGISIVVAKSPITTQIHGLQQRAAWDHRSWHDINYRPPRAGTFRQIVLSECAGKRETYRYSGVEIYPTWSEILPILEKEMGSGAKVCVYPYQGNIWQKVAPRA